MRRGVDVSNHQNGIFQATFEAMKAEGVEVVICGTDGTPAAPLTYPAQVRNARAAGLEVEAYVYLYFGEGSAVFDVAGRTNEKLDLIDSVGGVRRVWLDCEDTKNALGPAMILGLIDAARLAVEARGYEVGIYTGGWWWVPRTGNSVRFAHLPLWVAQYDRIADVDQVALFGGWPRAFRKQYADDGTAGGLSPIDLNVERDPDAVPAPGDPDDFQRGRSEMLAGIARDLPAAVEAFTADWLDRRYAEWGVRR